MDRDALVSQAMVGVETGPDTLGLSQAVGRHGGVYLSADARGAPSASRPFVAHNPLIVSRSQYARVMNRDEDDPTSWDL